MEKIEKNVDKNSNNITPPSVPVQNEDDGEEERFISYNSHYPDLRQAALPPVETFNPQIHVTKGRLKQKQGHRGYSKKRQILVKEKDLGFKPLRKSYLKCLESPDKLHLDFRKAFSGVLEGPELRIVHHYVLFALTNMSKQEIEIDDEAQRVLHEYTKKPEMNWFPWFEIRATWKQSRDFIKLFWLRMDLAKETKETKENITWNPWFTSERPCHGSRELKENADRYPDETVGLLKFAGIAFDQNLIDGDLQVPGRDDVLVQLEIIEPTKKGIRAWLSDFNKNPIKNWCRINSVSGRKLQISFYNYNAKKSLLEELADPTQPNPLIAIKYRRQSENEDQAMKCFLTLVPEEEKFTLRITPIEPIQETEIQQ
ncbi:unnamed protein product, partial [Mesorhabditis belari]|uniref:Uncharacterized protein n=1 Tax=Mesorhabditis belari TaxID=2138241 RepID=A0AAF3FPM2_9BILA